MQSDIEIKDVKKIKNSQKQGRFLMQTIRNENTKQESRNNYMAVNNQNKKDKKV